MNIYINDEKVPYIDVAYEFARNPSRFSYELTTWHNGDNLIQGEHILGEEVVVPIIINRRGTSSRFWSDVIEELTGILYTDESVEISFGLGRYYFGKIMELNINEEHEYVAKAEVVIIPEVNGMFGGGATAHLTEETKNLTVAGQLDVGWTAEVVFGEKTDKYELVVGDVNIILNYNFIENDKLFIDYKDRSVFLRERDLAVALDIRSNWGKLKVGKNKSSTTQDTEIRYNELYY